MSSGPYSRRDLRCQKCKTRIAIKIAKLPVSLNIILNQLKKLIKFKKFFIFFSGKGRILEVEIFDKVGLLIAKFDLTAAELVALRNGKNT